MLISFCTESAQCYECNIVLKRAKFRVQMFEDPLVEKEIDIRRKVCYTVSLAMDVELGNYSFIVFLSIFSVS